MRMGGMLMWYGDNLYCRKVNGVSRVFDESYTSGELFPPPTPFLCVRVLSLLCSGGQSISGECGQ